MLSEVDKDSQIIFALNKILENQEKFADIFNTYREKVVSELGKVNNNLLCIHKAIQMDSDYPIVNFIIKEQVADISKRVSDIYDMMADSTVEKIEKMQSELKIAMKHLNGITEVVENAY